VPFRTEKGVLRNWVSRFDVWPYLERFSDVQADELSTLKWIIFLSASSLYAHIRFSSSAIQGVQCCNSIEKVKKKYTS
jgi:hypothetical protein